MVLLASANLPMGMVAPDFQNLPATDGNNYSLSDFNDKLGLVVIFMCVHCPYVQAIESQIIDIQNQYGDRDLQVIGINANDTVNYPQDDMSGMQARAAEYNYGDIVYLQDESQEVAKAYQATCTPDIYLFDEERELIYHGRIEELPAAIDQLLVEAVPAPDQIPSQGCSIKWK